MAEAISSCMFSCPICRNFLKCPVTIVCGHSYCMGCINQAWDEEDQKAIYSCPECRQTFTSRPILSRNVMLAEVLEKLYHSGIQETPHPSTELGNTTCFECTGRKRNAFVSCLLCRISFCESHYAVHEIQHSGHHGEQQRQLHTYISNRITEKEKDLQTLGKAVKYMKGSAHAMIEYNKRIFTELIRSIEKIPSKLTQQIMDKERTELDQAEGLVKQLAEEIADLRRRAAELEQPSETGDDVYASQVTLSGSKNSQSSTYKPNISFGDVLNMVSEMKQKILDLCNAEVEKIAAKITDTPIITLEPRTRKEFLKCFCHLTLDPNTVHCSLLLSKENSEVEHTSLTLPYPDHPDRFDYVYQVLCKEAISGQCYWEVQWSGRNGAIVAVSYKGINRKGSGYVSLFGYNEQSWRLRCTPLICSFKHNNKEIQFPPIPSSSRIGVYVDHTAGTLSFYQVSEPMILIHRVKTTFTEPLYIGFGVHIGSFVNIYNPLV
ncbi:tripartite motif-containing protein 16-like protein [Alosa sapidissima]|uniref:tripartite motif-containing protein 16-like protein n=1 Tax=Alosa sapidissima TaxID=34773 RepID=UPI001C096BF8|nr:tripartite motif-containing protein 16-like protein [Alosa sapidissima]